MLNKLTRATIIGIILKVIQIKPFFLFSLNFRALFTEKNNYVTVKAKKKLAKKLVKLLRVK